MDYIQDYIRNQELINTDKYAFLKEDTSDEILQQAKSYLEKKHEQILLEISKQEYANE